VEAAARTAGRNGDQPGKRPMTRHGMTQTSAAGAQPLATDPRMPMVIADADRRASDQRRADNIARRPKEAACPHPSRRFPMTVAPSMTSAEIRNPHSHRLWPAGSFLGDFRTPAGARNSSRHRTGRYRIRSAP
jgi:hypothetical protein